MTCYHIQVHGHLDRGWEALFDGFSICHDYTPDHQPVTVITGPVADQAALYGLLGCLSDLGVGLISVLPEQKPPGDV
jgi:hypothetical protein